MAKREQTGARKAHAPHTNELPDPIRVPAGWEAAALALCGVSLGASLAYMGSFAIGVAVEGHPVLSPWSEARRDVMGVLCALAVVSGVAGAAGVWWAWRPLRPPGDLVETRDPGPGRVIR